MYGGFKGKPCQMKRSKSDGKKRIEDEPRSVETCPFCCDGEKAIRTWIVKGQEIYYDTTISKRNGFPIGVRRLDHGVFV